MYIDLLVGSLARAERTRAVCGDLRVRLQSIQEDAKHLLDPSLHAADAESGRILGSIRDASASLLHVVSTLDDVGNADDTRAQVLLQPVRVNNLLADVQRRERPGLSTQVELQWKVPHDLPTIQSDPLRLAVVLESLI